MRAWVTLCQLDSLTGESSEETWQLVLESGKPIIGLSLFSLARWDILRKGYVVLESFADHMPAFVRPTCFTALGCSDMVTHMPLAYLVRFVLNTFDGWEALQIEESRDLWNPIINKS